MTDTTPAPARAEPALEEAAVAKMLHRAADVEGAAGLVERFGEQMLAAGGAVEVVRLAAGAPGVAGNSGDSGSRRLTLVLADALRMSGQPVAARRVLAPLLAAPGPGESAALAWRSAALHYLCGDYARALADVERALAQGEGAPAGDLVALRAVQAHCLEMTGRRQRAAAAAEQAMRSAQDVDDDRLLATAGLAIAATSEGAPRDDALALALAAAERSGDVTQQARALLLQSHALLEAALYGQAHEVAARAVRAAELGSPPGLLSVALYNDGEALTRLGRLAEARTCFTRSVQLCRRAGLQRSAAGLRGLGDVNRRAGLREAALRAYEDAVALSRPAGELQVLVPALAGWATTAAEGSPAALGPAREAAAEAVRRATPALLPLALTARGWVAVHGGDTAAARRDAEAAVTAARAGPGEGCLPDALELLSAVAGSAAASRTALREALALWDAAGVAPCADQVRLRLARLPGAGGTELAAGRAATRRLAALGIAGDEGSAGHGGPLRHGESAGHGGSPGQVRVRVLGGFEVEVRGDLVPLAAWRSRQARTLLKILASRRGRPVARAELCELLWPDDDPRRTGHRLSVLLSAVRGVLDPVKAYPPDHHLRADLHAVSVDLAHVAVDLEELLQDAAHGCALLRGGDRAGALEVLGAVDAAYSGDAFDEDPYAEWAEAPREHARAVWLRCVRHLVDLSCADGDEPRSVELLARALAADAYDEGSHRALVDLLVRCGRHGEARRAYARWDRVMATIGAPGPPHAVVMTR